MRIARSRDTSRRGGVLIATLVLVMSVGAISICLLELDSARTRRQVASVDNKRAFNLAEAGLAEACFGLWTGRTGNVGDPTMPAKLGDGLFWVTATDLGDDMVGLESTGMAGTGRVTLSLVVRREPRTLAMLGVLGATRVSVGSGAVVDAYDSRNGTASDHAPLRSNADIFLGSMARIRGDATPGPEGMVRFGLLANVTGSTAPAQKELALPAIEVPKLEPAHDIDHSGRTALVVPPGETSQGTLRVRSGSTVVLRGPSRLVVDRLIVDGTGTLEIDDSGGPVEIFVTDWLDLNVGSTLRTASSKPSGLSLLVPASLTADRDGDGSADPPVDFRCNSPFYGTLYAPKATLSLTSGFHVYGTIAAQSLAIGSSGGVHFDEALLAAPASSDDLTEALAWRIVEIPSVIANDLSVDPFSALGVVASALPKPADAHETADTMISITYLDLSLVQRTYNGPEADFDWSAVKLVLNLVRATL
jgi:hypothetical protein